MEAVDGARAGRNYYTDFVKMTPQDTVILTLACGKYRFNDLELGSIGELPRLMDIGQCNDAYSAIKIALALAEAFDCSVNELPLSMVLSSYEPEGGKYFAYTASSLWNKGYSLRTDTSCIYFRKCFKYSYTEL